MPRAYAHTRHLDSGECVPGLRLLVYCDTAELATMADLLAGPIVADSEPNRYGSRYQRVTRSFGRVDLEAYAMIEDSAP